MISLLKAPRKLTPIGLDIGANGVRAVQLMRTGDRAHAGSARFVVAASASTDRERASTDLDGALPTREELARLLRRSLAMGPFRGRRTCAILNPPALEFHTLELPVAVLGGGHSPAVAESRETAEMARQEVARLSDGSGDGGQVDVADGESGHWVLPPTSAPAPNAIGVTTDRQSVAQTLGACTDAGIVCTCVDAGAAALARLGAILNAWSTDQVWCVLDVGHTETRLVLCVDEVPVLVRRAGSGARAWTERIAETLQLSVASAEVHKCEHGIAFPKRGVSDAVRGVRAPEVGTTRGLDRTPRSDVASILFGALRKELKDLASQIKRSYEYALSCYPRRQAAGLVLVGGGAVMRHLPEFLNDALGIPVRRASEYLDEPSCRLSFDAEPRGRLELLASAVGAAVTQLNSRPVS